MIFEHGNKINGRAGGALMEPLEKSVLSIGAFIAPDNWTGHASRFSVSRDAFTVTFHFKLLEESRQFSYPS